MDKTTLALCITLATASGTTLAASHEQMQDHSMMTHHAAQEHTRYPATGVVKALKDGKIQIAHEPVEELDWPAMTMWFELKGNAGRGIKVGDRVRFEMMQGGKKKWVIEKIGKK